MEQFPYVGDKIEEFYQQRQISLKTLCEKADVKYATLHSQINHRRPIPFRTVQKISRAWGVSIGWFDNSPGSGEDEFDQMSGLSGALVDQVMHSRKLQGLKTGESLDILSLTLLYYEHGGLYSALEPYKEQFDTYYCPEKSARRPRLFHMGKESLTSRTLGECNMAKLQADLDAAPEHVVAKSVQDQKRASRGEFIYGIEQLNAMAESHKMMVRMDYLRILIRFECEENGPLIVNLSELLR